MNNHLIKIYFIYFFISWFNIVYSYSESDMKGEFQRNEVSSKKEKEMISEKTELEKGVLEENQAQMSSCILADDCPDLPCRAATCISGNCEYRYEFSSKCRTFGYPEVLALRVIAQDTQATNTKSELSNYIFGTGGKNFTMTSQFSACSYKKFNIAPFSGVTISGVSVSDGTDEVEIFINATDEVAGTVADMAIQAATAKFGDLESQFAFVMLCLPPGTKIGASTNWKAYAFVNAFQSIYNDKNCIYPSIQMHELGHNLGLSHSNDEENYGDRSGMMGLSSSSLDGPIKCFNAPKSFQLGWYDSKIFEVSHDMLETDGWVALGSIAYYNELDSLNDRYLMIRLINGNDGYDYYVNYNIAKGINSGTEEGADSVMITKVPIGQYYADSILVARLAKTAESYAIVNFDKEVSMKVFGYNYAKSSDVFFYTRVTKHRTSDRCKQDRDCDDLSKCTSDYCNDGKCELTDISCDICGQMVTITLTTNQFPELVVWTIENINDNRIARASGYFEDDNVDFVNSECLEHGKYKFAIVNAKSPTPAASTTKYSVRVGDILLDEGEVNDESYVETLFTICSSDIDCIDYDGCTVDFCNLITKLCNNTAIDSDANCINCSWLLLNITTDNFPEETTWILYRNIEQELEIDMLNDYVISGDPYPLFAVGFGRRKAPTKAGGRRKAPTRSNTHFVSKSAQFNTKHKNFNPKQSQVLILENENNVFERFCIEKGFLYQFTIQDSFGDGICCEEGKGEYYLNLDGKDILRGGNFESLEEIFFVLMDCETDESCDDDNLCTSDACMRDISTCIYQKKHCSECGAMFNLTLRSDNWEPQQNYVALFDMTRNKLAFTDGPYTGQDIVFNSSKCLQHGKYLFRFYDDEFGDFIPEDTRRPKWNGNFNVSINNVKLKQKTSMGCYEPYADIFDDGNFLEESALNYILSQLLYPHGNFGKDKSLNETFLCLSGFIEIEKSSIQPSISALPTKVMSSSPSLIPSIVPTEANNWALQFDKVETVNGTKMSNVIYLYYNISKHKSVDQLKATILEETCSIPDVQNTLEIIGTKVKVKDGESLDSGVFSFKYNISTIEESDLWENKSKGVGILSFCIRSELLLDDDDVSVSFLDTRINLEFDFRSSSFTVSQMGLEKAHVQDFGDRTSFSLTSCVCSMRGSEDVQCIPDAKLKQNDVLEICVFAEDGLQISKFESVYLYQDNIVMLKAIENGISNKFTFAKVGRIGHVSTSLVSALFLSPSPSPVVVKGNVMLDLHTTRALALHTPNHLKNTEVTFYTQAHLENEVIFLAKKTSVISALLVFFLFVLSSIRKRGQLHYTVRYVRLYSS